MNFFEKWLADWKNKISDWWHQDEVASQPIEVVITQPIPVVPVEQEPVFVEPLKVKVHKAKSKKKPAKKKSGKKK